ncbi:hypothetical protein HAX54_010559 [Datura stramonium]|uniref:Uncharacterized protein n=1 Tax=Datura stramonium TaxID=4076 RepID=A0ABS8TI83_DATST|nr:hypothetical protein [Datura stramonium]
MSSSTDKPSSPPSIPDVPPLSSISPPNEGQLGSLATSPSVASPGYSMKTAPTSLSPEVGSDGSPSHFSLVEIELSSLLTDIRSRYDVQEPKSPYPSLPNTLTSLAGSASYLQMMVKLRSISSQAFFSKKVAERENGVSLYHWFLLDYLVDQVPPIPEWNGME